MYCKNCGKQISDDSIFCRFCGTCLEEEICINNEVIADKKDIPKDIAPLKEEPVIKVEIKKKEPSTKANTFAKEVVANLKMLVLALGLFIAYMLCFIISRQDDIKPMDDNSYWGESCYDPKTLSGKWWFDWERHYAHEIQSYDRRIELNKLHGPGEMADYLISNQPNFETDWLLINNMSAEKALKYANEKAQEKNIDSTLLKQYKETAISNADADKENFYGIINESRKFGYEKEREEHAYTSLWISLCITILGRYFIKFCKWVKKNNS